MSRNGAGRSAWLWGVLAAVLVIVVAAAFLVDRLNDYAQDRIRSEAYLFSIGEDAAEEHIAVVEALGGGAVYPAVEREVSEDRRELRQSLDALAKVNPDAESLSRVREALGPYEAAIDKQLGLIESGRLREAEASENTRVDPSFEALHQTLEEASARYEDAARRATLIADVSTYATMFLAAIALTALLLARQREETSRVRQEQERRSREHFRSLIQNASDVILIIGTDRTVGYVSPSVERVLGYKPEEVIGKDNLAPVHPDDLGRLEVAVAEALGSPGTPSYAELRLRHADGSWRHVETTCTSLLDDPAVSGIVFNSRDVTERRRVEEALRESEERLQKLAGAAFEGIIIHDGGEILAANKAYAAMHGYEIGEIVGRSALEWAAPEYRDLVREHILSGHEEPYESAETKKDGTRIDVEVRGKAISYRGRTVRVAAVRDITERKRTETALRESEERYRAVVEQAADALFVHDLEGNLVDVNQQACDNLGYTREELLSLSVAGVEKNLDAEALESLWDRVGSGGPITVDGAHRRKDGTTFPVEVRVGPLITGGRRLMLAAARDVTERKEAERALREAEEKYRTLVEQIPAITYVEACDEAEPQWNPLYVSPQVEDLLGYPPEEWLTSLDLWSQLLHPDDRGRVMEEDTRTEETGEPFRTEYRMFARDGRVLWIRDEAVLVRDASGRPRFWQGVMYDITERKALERRLEHQALHDSLTGLPNRALFAERLARTLASSDAQGGKVAVLFVDLDDFKSVNDSLGHWAGDGLLELFARRLQESVRPGDTVARFGGDEFAVLLEGVTEHEAVEVAKRAIEEMRGEPFVLGGREILATPSIGVAVSGHAERGREDLMRRADLALHRAKEAGKSRHACFTPDLEERLRARLRLEGELRGALERGEFRVFYQPKVSIESGEIVGVEALVRWEHPERGLLAPSEFLAAAEETGLIVPIGERVLRVACRQAKEWQGRYPKDPPLAVSVNLSAKQFGRGDLAEHVGAVLGESGLDPRALTLEITESTAMEDAGETAAALGKLKAMGVRIEVDDFGTGYSSLAYLRLFPVDYLKVDRSFVAGLGRNPNDEGIVRAVVSLARTLGLEVVAEGVENGEQLGMLREMGCGMAQGNYFWGALPAEAAGELLAAYNA